jgi:hypothetical protein
MACSMSIPPGTPSAAVGEASGAGAGAGAAAGAGASSDAMVMSASVVGTPGPSVPAMPSVDSDRE